MEQIKVHHNKQQLRFEVEVDGEFAYIDYRYYKENIAYMHAFVPVAARGKGIAEAIAVEALDFARATGKKIMLYCPFVSKFVKAHKEYHDLVDRAYHPTFLR